ncbi:MAG TPA: GAF domain-containing sensor histidine kinase, partial [Terriglobales bacterium]|nr:GAF domain-containing sensor histidine kinase [Terriglobales bacterium]
FYQHFGIGAFTAVPMRLRERYAGSLCAINFGGGRPFLPRQVELLAGIARQLAVALETAELYRHQREESEISAALARVSHQLLAWLDRPRLLDRFGRLSCEILECESSYTLLGNTEEGAYLPVHSHGAGTRRGEPLELVPVPLELFATIETALAHDDAVQLQPADFGNPIAAAAAARSGIQRVLFLALRSGYDLIGLHLACHHGEQRFSPRQIRLGRGMAQLASVALRNARLVQQLEGANRLKSDFVATMSHELRTPLNIVIGYNDLLREGVFGELNTEQIEALLRMQNSATNLLRLIDSTLDVSRLETGEVRLALQWVDVGELLAEIETEREEARRRPELLVEWSAPSTPLQMLTDRGKLKVIIKNLVGNAIKFTERGQVKVGVARLDDLVEIAVEDTGIGIAPEVLPVIFEPFRQGDSSDTRPYGGVGLGLYIVRRLVELLGGTIAVETAVGQGTTFRVRLPLTA